MKYEYRYQKHFYLDESKEEFPKLLPGERIIGTIPSMFSTLFIIEKSVPFISRIKK